MEPYLVLHLVEENFKYIPSVYTKINFLGAVVPTVFHCYPAPLIIVNVNHT
jgi:hypothetical protein